MSSSVGAYRTNRSEENTSNEWRFSDHVAPLGSFREAAGWRHMTPGVKSGASSGVKPERIPILIQNNSKDRIWVGYWVMDQFLGWLSPGSEVMLNVQQGALMRLQHGGRSSGMTMRETKFVADEEPTVVTITPDLCGFGRAVYTPWNKDTYEAPAKAPASSTSAAVSSTGSAISSTGAAIAGAGLGAFGGLVSGGPGHFGQGGSGMLRTANGWAVPSTGNWSW